MGKLLRGMSRDGSARILVLDSTDITAEATAFHHSAPTATAALGRLLTGASMIGSLMGEKEDRLTLAVSGNGPCGKLIAVSDWCGNVKGYVENPAADPPRKKNKKLDVGAAVGQGTLAVIREHGTATPQIGTVELVSGEIAEDITRYFAESEQIPTLCALGVLVGADGVLIASGGVLIQLLPFADETVIAGLEKNAAALSDISRLFREGKTPKEVADIAMAGIEYDIFDELTVTYRCDCGRIRMRDGIRRVGEKEILRMLREEEAEGHPRELEAVCRFCGKKYRFTESELLKK